MILSLCEYPGGIETRAGNRVVYDIARDEAWFGEARVDGHALVWELGGGPLGAALAAEVALDPGTPWLLRCDRVDFPPGGIAYRHTHPGPGIRRLVSGALTIDAGGHIETYGPGDAWLENGPEPVLATASKTEPTAFVRVLLLPREWAGKRTIRYVDPADEERPKLQKARVYLEQPIEP